MKKLVKDIYKLLPSIYGKLKIDNLRVCGIGLGMGLLLLVACSPGEQKIHPEDIAAETAKTYYDQLLHGDVKAYVDGMVMHSEVVPSYREQLETNMKMFIGQQEKEHQGIKSVSKVRGELTCPVNSDGTPKDSTNVTVNAFLMLNYGDNTAEQVVVPMVKVKGVWMMR